MTSRKCCSPRHCPCRSPCCWRACRRALGRVCRFSGAGAGSCPRGGPACGRRRVAGPAQRVSRRDASPSMCPARCFSESRRCSGSPPAPTPRLICATSRTARSFAAWWLTALTGNLGVFIAADIATFYLFFAMGSLAAYGLIAHDGTSRARRAGAVYVASHCWARPAC